MTDRTELADRLRKGLPLPEWALKHLTPERANDFRGKTIITTEDAVQAADILSFPSPIQVDEAELTVDDLEELAALLPKLNPHDPGDILLQRTLPKLLAAIRLVTVDEWRDIETDPPPKDGTWVLLFSPDSIAPQQFVGQWRDDEFDKQYGGAWWEDGDRIFCIDADPTHWQPLPKPPQAAIGSGRK